MSLSARLATCASSSVVHFPEETIGSVAGFQTPEVGLQRERGAQPVYGPHTNSCPVPPRAQLVRWGTMGKVPVRLKEVVYMVSPFEVRTCHYRGTGDRRCPPTYLHREG